MPIIKDPRAVADLFAEAAQNNYCIPAFCTDHQAGTECIVKAAYEMGQEIGVDDVPIVVAFTESYPPRSQTKIYTAVPDIVYGTKAVLDDIELLMSDRSPYKNVRVLIQIDHGQPDLDKEILENWLDKLSLVMYDGSEMPLDKNIEMTAQYVAKHKDTIAVEGCVDEIAESGGKVKNELTTPEDAKRFIEQTGCLLIVANLGTEHRATMEEVKYHGERAREIRDVVGKKLVLHGSTSLKKDDITSLKDDGVIKANVWTMVEKIGSKASATYTIRELGNILDKSEIEKLIEDGFLGRRYLEPDYVAKVCGGKIGPKLAKFPEVFKKNAYMDAVVPLMKQYMYSFGYENLAKR